MSNIIEQRMLVMTNAGENNNKFWEATLYDNHEVVCRWGRTGVTNQSKTFPGMGKGGMEVKIREKTGKGYREIAVVGKASSAPLVANSHVHTVAANEIAGNNPTLQALVKRLAEANKHQILAASGGKMTLDLSTGIIETPVGVVTMDNIDAARLLLGKFDKYVKKQDYDNPKFMASVDEYLMYVPQKVDSKRGWHRILFNDVNAIVRQSNLLDQLESSVDMAGKQIQAATATAAGKAPPTFAVKLNVLEDKKVIAEILKFYEAGINARHQSRHLKPIKFYEIEIGAMNEGFQKDGAKMSNIQRLWHGTRVHNVLSIFKSGLIIPKSNSSIQITGRMFGDGLYFSDQATKSLNYSHGYWDGGAKDNNCFMFLADVAMGNAHIPKGPSSAFPVKGSDSTFAKADHSGVMNNEMIVYRTSQANLRYLVEFA